MDFFSPRIDKKHDLCVTVLHYTTIVWRNRPVSIFGGSWLALYRKMLLLLVEFQIFPLFFFTNTTQVVPKFVPVRKVSNCRSRQGRKQMVKEEEEELFFLSSSFEEKKKSASKVFTVATGVFSILHTGQLVGQLQSNSCRRREDNNRCFFSELLSSLKTKLKS
jgi:hypothetical protein